MEIKLQSIHMNRVNCRNSFRLTVDDDVNVPDNKADVQSIIRKTGTVRLNEKKVSGTRLYMKGILSYHVLYLSEDKDRVIQSIRGELPFDESVELPEECREENLCVRAEIEEFEIGMIHSRKLAIRALLGILVQAEELHDVRAAVGIENGGKIYTRTKKIPVTSIAVDKKDTVRLREDFFLPSGKESVEELLYWEMLLRNTQARAKEGSVEAKGELSLFAIWQGDSENENVECYETVLPFQTDFEISGCKDGLIEDVSFRLMNESLAVKANEDGENRLFEAEAVLEAEMKLYEEGEMELIADLYATDGAVTPTMQEEEYENLLLKNDSRYRMSERLPLEEGMPGILQICRGSAEIKPDVCERDGETLKLSGILEVDILYISEDDSRPFQSYHGELPFRHQIEIRGLSDDSTYDIRCNVAEATFSMVRSAEAEVRADLDFSVLAMEKRKDNMIVDAQREEFDANRFEELPSMVGYIVKNGETLWDIAKRYSVAEDEIIRPEEHGSEVREGETLLLVKAANL